MLHDPIHKIHDPGKLGKMPTEIDSSLSDLAEKSAPLTEYAVQFRYPEEDKPATLWQAKSGVSLAKRVHREILKRLAKENV